MTTPSSHEGYRKIARGALRGRGSVVAKTDWEVFLHGFCDTNQLGDSRRIYDCLIDLFPTPEAVLRWPVHDPTSPTGERLELPETGGCQNFRSRIGAGNWLRRNAENWEGIRAFLRCDTPEKKRAARDFTGRTTRDYIGSLNRRLRNEIVGAGMKGADMHLLWGGCEVPVIDIQLVRYMAPHVLGMDFKEHVRERLIEHKTEGHALQLDPDRPASERRIVDARDIDVDSNTHISAMEKAEITKIQENVGDYNRWREAAYQMAEAEGIPVNQWHVATWLESRAGGDPDKNLRQRTRAEAAEDNLRLEGTQRFTARTFGPTDFPEVPASWPLPPERYPRRERRKRLAQMRSDGVSRAEMAEREGISRDTVASDLEFYDLQQSRLPETPSDYDRETAPPIYHGTIFDFSPEEIKSGTRGEGIWLASNRQAAEKMTRYGQSVLAPKDASIIRGGIAGQASLEGYYGARVFGYKIKPEARIHIIPYWDGADYEPLIEALVREGADVLEIVRTEDIAARGNRASYYLVQNPDVLEPVSIAQAMPGVEGFHEVSLWDAPSETPSHYNSDNAWAGFVATTGNKYEITEEQLLKYIRNNPRLTRPELAYTFDLPEEQVKFWETHAGMRRRSRRLPLKPIEPSAFVGFETPFGFDDNITVMWQDWVQYKIDDTPVIVKRVKAKPGTKVNPRYKGATAPQELEIDFRLRASNRKDMQKIDFLLERLREDNPTMTVRVNVKTNGKVARRNLPSWQERPYRLEPAMYIGYQSPDEYDSNIQSFRWEHTVPHPDMEDHALITTTNQTEPVPTTEVEHLLGLQRDNPLGLDEQEREEYKAEYFKQSDSTSAHYEIDGVRVYVQYGSYTLGYNAIDPTVEMETINNAASVSIQRLVDTKADINTFRMIGKFLDRIKEENPGIRLFAEAKGDPVNIMDSSDMPDDEFDAALAEAEAKSKRDIRARVYGRYGWERLYEMEGEDRGGWAMEYRPSSPSAFTGIERYADAIMELV